MAKFLDTSGISHQLVQIISGSRGGRLLLISPYLKFNKQIKDRLEEQVQTWKTNVVVIYGKTELRAEETQWLAKNGVTTSYREHLHAKCYMNDSHALITSMNLYEFSQQNNDEMGILVSAVEDPELYEKIKEEAERIYRRSVDLTLNVTPVEPPEDVVEKNPLPKEGSCVRCGETIPFDMKMPYCKTCYRSWARYRDDEYEEKHCHICGEEHGTSMAKPVCRACYRTHRTALRATASTRACSHYVVHRRSFQRG